MNAEELKDKMASDVKPVKELGQYLQDKLIAVSTAIIGFTVVMFGSGKMALVNICLLKLSWFLFGIYLLLGFCSIWASINYTSRRVVRDAMIRLDEADLIHEMDPIRKKDKETLIVMLKVKDVLDRDYWSKSRKERENDRIRQTFRGLVNKYRGDLLSISVKKNQDIDYRSKRDCITDYFIKNYELPYAVFAFGLIILILSVVL